MSESSADSLFVDFLRRGQGADFDAFCAAHPADADRLRDLHAQHELALAHLRAAGITSITPAARPSPSALKPSPGSSELLRRILAQGSKGARYELRGEIARGGMGAILRVWDEDLGRELAMKVVLGSDGTQADAGASDIDGRRVSRFLEEAQITGQLDHPCVVPVHELGLDGQARVYFTMRLVKGRDFGRILELVQAGEEGWSRTRALGVLLRVCEAMAYAHSKGVVHRDLKPANVMVGKFGEVYVMDWGLARVLGRADVHDLRLQDPTSTSGVRTSRSGSQSFGDMAFVTMDGDVMGTPAYMPPEQARGKIEQIEARSDVYAIGAMLYHLLAGQMPFVGRGESKSNVEVLNALLDGPPPTLREVCPDLPAELEAICDKAMARDMAARYPDTLEFAEDLRAFLEGRVVKAYQTGALVELRKWVARNKPLASAAAAAILFLVAGLIGSLWQKSVADRNADIAEKNAGIAERNAALAAEKALEAERKGELATASAALAETRAVEAANSAARAGAVRDFLTDMLAQANPFNALERDMPVSRLVDEAAERLDAGGFATDPGTEVALRTTLGATYQGISRFDESERQYRIAVDLLSRSGEAEPLVAIRLDIDLADALSARGQYREADQLALTVLEELDGVGTGSDETSLRARTLMLRASCSYNLGDTEGAIALARASVELREESNGPDTETTSTAREKLAFYLVQGRHLDEALQHVERALAVLQAGSARARLHASTALRTRASIHSSRRRTKAAIADLEEALRIRQERFGEESAFVGDVYEDLSRDYGSAGEGERSESYARKALDLRRRFLGDHRDTATSLMSVGNALRQRKVYAEARPLLEEGLAMRRKVFGPDSSPVGASLRRLAWLSSDEGDLATAERLLLESTANWEKSLGPDHRDLADNWIALAEIMSATDRSGEARALLERALALRIDQLGSTAAQTSSVRDALITHLLAARDWRAAEELLRAALPVLEAKLTAGHPLVPYTGAQLGAALVGLENYDEAEPLLLAGWKAIGDDPKMWAVNKLLILDNLVALYSARGDAASVALYREKAALLGR